MFWRENEFLLLIKVKKRIDLESLVGGAGFALIIILFIIVGTVYIGGGFAVWFGEIRLWWIQKRASFFRDKLFQTV